MSDAIPSFEEFLESLSALSTPATPIDPSEREPYEEAATSLKGLATVDRATLAELISTRPEWVPIFASIAGLSQEQLKNVLRHQLGSSGWRTLAQNQPDAVVDLLDEQYGLVEQIVSERVRDWSYGDVLFERIASRSRAGRAIGRGRGLEDSVETIVRDLGLTYEPRTRFVGRSNRSAPCDVAMPKGGRDALIVCAVKGFDSTGSKLTDALREIEQMAEVRDPRQFVYAVVDGIGWLSRQADLRRIHSLWATRAIDGLFSLAQLEAFSSALAYAARIHRLV